MRGVALIFAFAVFAAGGGCPASAAEQAGPPASAAPPKPPTPAPVPFTTPPAAPRSEDNEAATYERCLSLAKSDPGAARDLAERWRSRGGAHPADHCYAVALVGLNQYKDGAAKLETLAQAMVHAPASLRAQVLDQASQAWLLAGDPARAYTDAAAALNLLPNDADILIDRAEAAGSQQQFDKAVEDLDRALKLEPNRVEALIYRASAYRGLNKLGAALADIDRALGLAPDSVPALLERGDIRRLSGDLNGARQDWVRVSILVPGSEADEEAKMNIERLELKDSPPAPGVPKR
ncbi:MAG: tetratricopeptide repeat protein [Alphaproteobacteria bacterium]|nr:tetratricopeptide repeat protein [Alphaproteobacteria bacterium]